VTQDAAYPKRKRFDAHRICRLLHKTCAAQEIGPLGAYLVTIIAHQEDSCRYRRPVTFYDGQLMPILGVTSQETLTTARRKAVAAGWLAYRPGHKGRASTYFACIPSHVSGTEDGAIDEGTDLDSPDLRSEKSTESRSNADRIQIEIGSNPDGKVPPFFPSPVPTPLPKENTHPACAKPDENEFTSADPNIDWMSAVAEFLSAWNASPAASKVTRLPHIVQAMFRECWSDPEWRERFPAALARLATVPTWHGRKLSVREFLAPLFVGELLDGVHDAKESRKSVSQRVATAASKPDPKQEAPPPKVLDRVTVPLLQRTPELVAWFHDAAAIGITDGTENSRHNVVAAATRALGRDIRDPVAWFISCVTSRAWERIGDEVDEVARKRLKDFDAGKRAKNVAPEIAAKLAEVAAKRSTADLTPAQMLAYGDGEEDAA
jgi:hypothetical protein